jgi:magnesium transporter
VIVDAAVYRGGRRSDVGPSLTAAVDACRGDADAFVWVGLYEPTHEEMRGVADAFDLHPLALEDAVHAHQRPKLDIYGNCLFVVLRTATYIDSEEVVELGELMAFAGDRFLVTVRHGAHTGLAAIRKALENDPERLAKGPAAVLHAMVDLVVDEYEVVLDDLDTDIDQIEAQVFSGERVDHSERIFKLKREVIDFRRAVRPLQDPITRLADGRAVGVEPTMGPWFRDILDHLLRVGDRLDALDDILTSALAANASQVGVRQNEDMRKISAWVAIAAVPTMVAGIYGMNFEHMPELQSRYGYPAVVAGLVFTCLVLYREFRRRGWL